ncbi:hypothetical protein SAMN03159341_1193 [Paenibacillus sp. 1_12]|nr:hypothetical protein SAMN03159341_1193 [Paenibacillus sp. 1_12]
MDELNKSDDNTYILINENESLFVSFQSNSAEKSGNKVVEGQYPYMADQSIISESDYFETENSNLILSFFIIHNYLFELALTYLSPSSCMAIESL